VLITQTRVVRYFERGDPDGTLEIYSLPFSQIDSVTLVEAGNMFNDSVYNVASPDEGSWFQIPLPAEDHADVRFVEDVRRRLR